MSSSKNNSVFKKTSFLAGNNSEFIEEFYADYLSDPENLPSGWQSFFDGLKENQDIISKNYQGPSWAPKKIKRHKAWRLFERYYQEFTSKISNKKSYELSA